MNIRTDPNSHIQLTSFVFGQTVSWIQVLIVCKMLLVFAVSIGDLDSPPNLIILKVQSIY